MNIFIQSFLKLIKKYFFIVLFILIFFLIFCFINYKNKQISYNNIFIDGENISLIIADTFKSRSRGLSIFNDFNFNEAMLFIFDNEDYYGFWMKDMKFSIDIVWLNKDNEIVYIKENAHPRDYPEIYRPNIKSLYVLEFKNGFVFKHNIQIGDIINFNIKK